MPERYNKERIEDILKTYEEKDEAEGESAVRDLLTDILHHCRINKYNFTEILKSASEVHQEEIKNA